MADLSPTAPVLSGKQQRLLELMRRERRRAAAPAPLPAAIPRRGPDEPAVLSFGQQRLWFIEQLQPGSAAYHVPGAVRIRGALDTAGLARCLEEVARRHEILRTAFRVVDGEPRPAIAATPRLPLRQIDLRHLPPARREAAAAQAVDAQVLVPFDLTVAPLARTGLVRLGDEEHVFLLVLHHVISDIWSVGVFFRNAMACYDALAAGRRPALPELPLQYADYAAWQQRRLSGESLAELLGYWREQLRGAPQVLELPADHARPAMQSFAGGRRYMNVGRQLTAALKAVSKRQDASLYMLLLAALDVLLYRYTGQPAILVGVPVANRNRLELEQLIGLLFNALVVRADLDHQLSFRELLTQVRGRILGALAHQDLPFERLVEELRIERDMSRNPLFQALFAFQNVPASPMTARGLALARYEVRETTSREDLELDLRETPEGLAGWFGFDRALFDAATISRAAGHFQALLAGIAADPDRRLVDLPLLQPAERQQLCEWNDTASGEAGTATAVELFAARAAAAPLAAAAAADGEVLSYGELDGRSNALAARLRQLGVEPGVVVPLLCRRGLDLLTAVLAVWKAGGAYLPLDPEHPARRQAQVLAASGARLVVADDRLLPDLATAMAALPAELAPRVASFASFASFASLASFASFASFASLGPAPPATRRAAPGDLAYVIFTSGSTGVPKGAMVEQRGMLNHLRAKIERLGLGPADVVAQTASQCFDVSVWQMVAPLLTGGRVEILGDEVAHDPARLLDATEAAGVTVLETVPSLLQLMLEEVARRREQQDRQPPALAALRVLVPTGEAVTPALCARWLADYPAVPLINAYGPTECSDDVSHHPVARPLAAGTARVPIGHAIPNCQLWVVDPRELAPLPAGVAGELCVGGIPVGRGYLGAADRTAEVFVPDPFAARPGARLYRTGDRVRRLPGGGLDFLGRLDHQVKVRGFRIELGEIESALARCRGVRQAAVEMRELGEGQRALVAFVAAEAPGEDAERELRQGLARSLPEYMVPAGFVFLQALPLTANGKLDRRVLQASADAGFGARGDYVAPRNPVEESLAAIWAAVLKRPRVGIHDNFFDLGGQSLNATQVVSRVREAFAVELPVRALFQKPEVASFAELVEEALLRGHGLPQAPPITRVPRQGGLPASFGQERLWFIDQLRPGLTAYNIFGAARLRGSLEVAVLRRSFDELARRHEVLRTTFAAADGRPVQLVGPASGLAVPMIDLRALPAAGRAAHAARLTNQEAQRPFDLARGPLIRALLLRCGEGDHLLAVTAHHVVYDVWSRELLIRELGLLYEAFWQRRPSPLPELPVQYADFAHWQRQWLRGDLLTAQVAYWRRQLAGVTAGTELPPDRPRPTDQGFRGRRVLAHLPAAVATALKDLTRRQGATLFMGLLAGFTAFLQRYTREDDVVVGSPIANRNRAETEALIGFFVNTQVLRTDVAGQPTLRQLLGRVREVALSAYAHQDLAFEQLVAELRLPRDPARQPLFQILFNFLTNYRPVALELPGLSLTPEPNHSGAVQFDLILSIYEADEELHLSADFSSDLFDGATLRRMLQHYGGLLAAAVAAPDCRIGDLPMVSPEQRQQLLREWNDTAAIDPPGVLERIAARSRARPQDVAVSCGGERLTYHELARRAAAVAGGLRALGVGPEVLVAVHLERSIEMVVALLGVLAAGGAYLPLDPSYPAERLAFQAGDAAAPLLVTSGGLAGKLAAPGSREVLIEDLWGLEPAPGQQAVDAAHLAYTIYTSGSSGRPKGVQVSHRNLACSTAARLDTYRPAPRAFLLLSSFAFDSSVAGIFGTLAGGGRLVVAPAGMAANVARLVELVRRERVSHLLAVPSLYSLLLEEPEMPALDGVVVAGEACTAELVARHRRRFPGTALWNEYGPTEATVWSSVHDCTAALPAGRVPIGRPVAHTRIYLLDSEARPVPPGAPGEICVGGGGVARGYLGRPDLTARVFVPDPLAGEPGARLYRTGDLARCRAGGEIEFLGRVDQQLKVRGFRVEPEEIEAALQAHPAVREAAVAMTAVTARGERGGEGHRRLVAFVVPAPGQPEPAARDLRAFLRQRLPEPMVPASFALVGALPLGANGKLDRQALAAVDAARLALPEVAYVAPRTPVEATVVALWTDLLGVERVGVHDNFFDLGGHSLLTTQLVSRLRDAYQVEVPLQTFFEEPTVGGLAASIELALWAGQVARDRREAATAGEPGDLAGLEQGEL